MSAEKQKIRSQTAGHVIVQSVALLVLSVFLSSCATTPITDETLNEQSTDCGCGTPSHNGVDWGGAPEGTPIPVADDGLVVKVEQNETVSCGRYVVVWHIYENGRSVYTRYAQLGRLVGKDDKPIRVGLLVRKKDKIGEVGKKGEFHFEVRPLSDKATWDRSRIESHNAELKRVYGQVPSMRWSKYSTADPRIFDFEKFGGKSALYDPDELRKAAEAQSMNTFRFIGNALVCKSDNLDPATAGFNCLRIGRVRVGDSYQSVREHNPIPYKETTLAHGVVASVFPIVTTKETKAYWVIGHRDDKIVSVQLTGNFSHPELSFSTIQLNDPEQKVIDALGPRYVVREVKEINGVLWDYFPFPITIEFVNRKVHSIRVAMSNQSLQPKPQSSAGER